MCKKCLWLNSRWEKVDIGWGTNDNVSTYEKCQICQMSQAESLPNKPQTFNSNHKGITLGLLVHPWSIKVEDKLPLLD